MMVPTSYIKKKSPKGDLASLLAQVASYSSFGTFHTAIVSLGEDL